MSAVDVVRVALDLQSIADRLAALALDARHCAAWATVGASEAAARGTPSTAGAAIRVR